MREDLDQKLCQKYPKIFAQRHGTPQETAMCWGFECGDGWYWLIDQLCSAIQNRVDQNPHLNIPQPVAVQVKEKFGGLRFYIDGGDEEIYAFIDFAEFLSYSICEECGSFENIGTTSGWIKTLCKTCFDKSSTYPERIWKPNQE